MKRNKKRFFTIAEITLAIAVLGIGMTSILAIFPVAMRAGSQAVKLSSNIHKLRAVASIARAFGFDETTDAFAVTGGKNISNTWANTYIPSWLDNSSTSNMDVTAAQKIFIPDIVKDGGGNTLYFKDGSTVQKGYMNVVDDFFCGRYTLKRMYLLIDNEIDTTFYLIVPKK